MKRISQFLIMTIPLLAFNLSGCVKCKDCYFIEETNGTTIENLIGEFCGDEIEEKENMDLQCYEGACYTECR